MRHSIFRVLFLTCLALTACGEPLPETFSSPPIQEALAHDNGSQVTVEGYVTVASGAFASALGEGFAVQDASGGLYVKLPQKLDLRVGTHVRVTGTLGSEYNRRILQGDPASVETLEGTRLFTPKEVTTGGLKGDTEGLLVHASGRVTRTFVDDSPFGYKVFFDDGSGEVQIFIQLSTGVAPAPLRALELGQHLEVTGFSTPYENIFQLCPRESADLVVR
jgi:hypothetical protein